MPAKKQAVKKRRPKQALLPNVMTGPELMVLLGGVSHVTIYKLWKAGKVKRVGQRGSHFLYDAKAARKFAETYEPQRNPAPKKKSKRRRA